VTAETGIEDEGDLLAGAPMSLTVMGTEGCESYSELLDISG